MSIHAARYKLQDEGHSPMSTAEAVNTAFPVAHLSQWYRWSPQGYFGGSREERAPL